MESEDDEDKQLEAKGDVSPTQDEMSEGKGKELEREI